MSNTLLTISDITNEGLMILENDLVIADKVNREYDDRFGIDGAKIGYTINVRKPARFKGTMGPALNVEDFVETSVPVTLTSQFHVDTQFITSDLLLSMDMFSKRVLQPKIATIANRIDYDLALAMSTGFYNITGTPGTIPTTVAPFLQAGAWLDSESVPRDGNRYMVLDQWTQASMAGSLTGLFNPQITIGEQYKKGMLGKATLGFDFYMDQNVPTQTFGALGGTPQFDSSQTSTALLTTGWADSGTFGTKGWTNSTAVVKVGDVFSVANVFAVNPQNRKAVGGGKPRYFVVRPPVGTPAAGTYTANIDPITGVDIGGTYTSSGTGTLQLTIASTCISAGQFQNVSGAPANSANLTFVAGTSASGPQNLAFHRDAFTLVSADLPLPSGVDMGARASHKDIGLSIRVVRQYTISNDALPTRLDVLYGIAPLYRELGCRVTG
jgi:hypothetical protein